MQVKEVEDEYFQQIYLGEESLNGNNKNDPTFYVASISNYIIDPLFDPAFEKIYTDNMDYFYKEAPKSLANEQAPLFRYSYLKVKVRDRKGVLTEVCLDLGTGRTLIGRSFLQKFKHIMEDKYKKLKGILKHAVAVS